MDTRVIPSGRFMSGPFTVEEEALFEKVGSGLLRRLKKTRNPADLLGAIRSSRKEFDRAYDAAPAEAKASVACRAGCGTCCHVPVGVQAHEVLLAAEFVQLNFSPEELEGVIARTAAHRAAFAGKSMSERAALKIPCTLLRDGSCSIYEARPEACRSHHSRNLEGCYTNLNSGVDLVDVLIPEIRGRMFAVMLGTDQGVVEAGFDGRAYDFGSALHEALTDSLCAARWMQRKPTFSESCWEVGDANEDADAGVIHPEGYFQ
jgi:Fe-S-cluster containining protein